MDTYKEVAEVNLWGTIRTTKAFLPLIRRAKGLQGGWALWEGGFWACAGARLLPP